MGKGDKKSRRGKIILGTYGVRRPRKKNKVNSVMAKTEENKIKDVSTNHLKIEASATENKVTKKKSTKTKKEE